MTHVVRTTDDAALCAGREHEGDSTMPLTIVTISGRVLLAMLFVLAGAVKITGPQLFLAHMAAHRVPASLLPAVAVFELGAGAALLIGWQLPIAAGALAFFCLATAFVFHLNLTDKAERTLFFKDVALAGALIVIAAGAVQVQ
jgi:putative oxidoreductase